MKNAIRSQLVASLNEQLVDELLEAHSEAKANFYLGGCRLTAVEGGRFCEAAFRLLEQIATGYYSDLGRQLNTQALIRQLENLPAANYSESIRLHIPRALRMVYDIRNKRDAAHLADGIDPNVQEASLVVAAIDWVLAELIRLYHHVPVDEAYALVEQIVTRKAPVVQEFNNSLKVLRPDLRAGETCLILLYHRGTSGASLDELRGWLPEKMRTNLKSTLNRLDGKALVHSDADNYYITRLGHQKVEEEGLLKGM